ncbi:hypothetical protein HELRODRAFT_81228 [Helobdella robusta]|uniref:Nuclear receptor domain-containing protein n=1 Tax=Helobdella robusta TaxID=6412 RepID=T1G4B8_HELRO|nr:hypothetical protein HELRODRAFT_81228 [Helobdella robusta]ESO01643.1 hypothetical protein HELRODRAFT_81228 [Helobdella robusta]
MNVVDGTICQICGDSAAGFYCGAYVCEACKKFFIRSLRSKISRDFNPCPSDGQCHVTKETRTQCPQCRYNKCLSFNMYAPGHANVSKDIKHIPCKVCDFPSSGFHYGAITCERCKGFFRRCILDRNIELLGMCRLLKKKRNMCKRCRYLKCLAVGMRYDSE